MSAGKQRARAIAISAFIAAWFLGHAWKGLFVYFQDDDMMNMYHAWIVPWHKLIVANIVPFTYIYRPLGSAFYRILYLSAGLNPLPFRICIYTLMMLNIWLIFRVARLLTDSTEMAALAALIGAYHNRFMDLFLNGGTVYDVLCFTFFWLAFSFYVAARRKYGEVTGRRLAWFCALFTLALNSKEMAASLPVVVLAYEWIYDRPANLSPGAVGRWLRAQKAVWISGIMTALATIGKTSVQSPFTGIAAYKVHFSVHQFFSTVRPSMDNLLFLNEGALNTTKVVLLFVFMWLLAIISRRKHLLLCATIITITPLPVVFIPYRGVFVMYVPWLGCATYAASVLVGGREWLWKTVWKRSPLPRGTWEPERIVLFLLAAYVLYNIQHNDRGRSFERIDPQQAQVRALKEALAPIRLPPASENRGVLFLRDGFTVESWDPLYIVRLWYREPEMPVDRLKKPEPGAGPLQPERYGLILDYCDERYREISPVNPEGNCPP